jgi:hypothetical protein
MGSPLVDHPGNLLFQFGESPDQQRGIRKYDGMPNPSVAHQEAIAALGELISTFSGEKIRPSLSSKSPGFGNRIAAGDCVRDRQDY